MASDLCGCGRALMGQLLLPVLLLACLVGIRAKLDESRTPPMGVRIDPLKASANALGAVSKPSAPAGPVSPAAPSPRLKAPVPSAARSHRPVTTLGHSGVRGTASST